jgi:hypothetical protein
MPMLGIEKLLTQVFGDNTLLIMLAGFFSLILLNLVIKLIIEIKKKNLRWDDVPRFIKPILLYGVFLIGLELLVTTGAGMPAVYEIFQGLQMIGYVAVMGKYFSRLYNNLKELGMPSHEKLDGAFEDKLDGLTEDTKTEISGIVEEYLKQKNKEAN